MTHPADHYTFHAANGIPNPPQDVVEITVESIMRDRNVGQKRAYAIFKAEREAQFDGVVPTNQRERMLLVLFRSGVRMSDELMVALHEDGYSINGHDTTKVLYSLQKTGHVRFREHQNPRYLYAIKLTGLGMADAQDLARRRVADIYETEAEQAFQASEHGDGFHAAPVEETIEGEAPIEAEIVDTQDPDDPDSVAFGSDPIVPAVSVYAFITEGYPTIAAVRDRARKAKKLAEAAAILEAEGEDEMALQLMSKTEFTDLEREIIAVLETLTREELR